jgi:hypothetical protein
MEDKFEHLRLNEHKIEEIFKREKGKKGKAIPATGNGGPQACETSRLPHFL